MCLLTVVLTSVARPLFTCLFYLNSHMQTQWCLRAPGSSSKCDVAGESLHVAMTHRWDHLTTSSLHNPTHPSSLALNYDLWPLSHGAAILLIGFIGLPTIVKAVLSRIPEQSAQSWGSCMNSVNNLLPGPEPRLLNPPLLTGAGCSDVDVWRSPSGHPDCEVTQPLFTHKHAPRPSSCRVLWLCWKLNASLKVAPWPTQASETSLKHSPSSH